VNPVKFIEKECEDKCILYFPELEGKEGKSYETYFALNYIAKRYEIGMCPIQIVQKGVYVTCFRGTRGIYDESNDVIYLYEYNAPKTVSLGIHELFERWLTNQPYKWSAKKQCDACKVAQVIVSIESKEESLMNATYQLLCEAGMREKKYLDLLEDTIHSTTPG